MEELLEVVEVDWLEWLESAMAVPLEVVVVVLELLLQSMVEHLIE